MTSNELILRYALLECRSIAERGLVGGWRHRIVAVVDKALMNVPTSEPTRMVPPGEAGDFALSEPKYFHRETD